MFWKPSKTLQENTFSRVILAYFTKRGSLPQVFPLEILENGWLMKAAAEQLRTAAFDVIQFLTI